jgi:hypothetical protein
MGDDDDLCPLGEVTEKSVESYDVRVVQWRVDLIEDAERRRFDQVESQQEAHRQQCAFAAGKLVDGLNTLPFHAHHDLDLRRQGISGIAEHKVGFPALEEIGKDRIEFFLYFIEGRDEPVPGALVKLIDGF